ncbi:transcriptional regulator, partial [Escherichia coli]
MPSQSTRLSPDSQIPDYFLRFSPVVMPVKVA